MSNPDRKQQLLEQGAQRRLSLSDNFEGFIAEVTIPAASEIAVRNQFKIGRTPRYYLIISDNSNGIIKRGDTTWTADFLYLKNVSSSSEAQATVFFMR